MGALRTVAEMMEIAARTAPKAKGEDFVVTRIIEGDELRALADAMHARGSSTNDKGFIRDGGNTANSEVVLLIGIKDAKPAGLNCGACGQERCIQINTLDDEFAGPQCPYRLLDMGIALGSAAKMASILNADSRIMYRIGSSAREIKLIDADFVMGIPLSATGKSIYFDR